MYAYTDSTGTDQVNDDVSLARLRAVQVFLSQLGAPADKAFDPSLHKFFGETFARTLIPDNSDSGSLRVVAIGLWRDLFKVPSPEFLRFDHFKFGRAQLEV
jgi:hypothetical protein